MANRNKLRENYEDALFALLMDDLAQQEGERLIRENETLKEDPAAAVPEAVNRRCLQTIRREVLRRKYKVSTKGIGRAVGRLAIAAVLMLALLTTAFAVSPALRAGALNLLLSFTEEAATWQSESGSDWLNTEDKPDVAAFIRQLPEGYNVSNIETDAYRVTTTYTNQAGEELELTSIKMGEAFSASFDIEDPDYYEETMIHGYPAIVVDKDEVIRIAWAEEDQGLMIYLYATDLSVEELKAIANDLNFE